MWFGEKKYAWGLLAVLWVFGCIAALSRFVMAYYQAAITEDFAVGRSFISLSWSLNLLIAALCMPLGGWLVDRYGVKKVMVLSTLLGATGSSVVFFIHHPVAFFIGYGIITGLVGIGSTTVFTLVLHWFERHRAKAMTIINSASPLGLAIVSPIFISYEGQLTWEYAFLITAALGIGLVLPSTLLFIRDGRNSGKGADSGAPDQAAEASGQPEETGQAAAPSRSGLPLRRLREKFVPYFGSPVIPVVMFALFTCGFNMGTVEMNMVAIHQHAHVPGTMIASALSLLGVMEVAGSFVFGYLLDRISRALALAVLYGFRVLGFTLLWFHLDLSPVLFSVLFGATYIGAIPGGLLLAGETLKGTSTQTGFLLLFHQAGGIIGALVAGFLFDSFGNYQSLIGVNITIAALVAAGYAWLHLRSRSKREASRPSVAQA
ncbi:MFS transporter [Paenibacillus elgii]|uniref:MFS transporter n=1 Tax=Paenibacillus elgii TaxID=189691 RepID=UPI002D7A52F1|nr:MFS transporter [Paenibacillus elgii]